MSHRVSARTKGLVKNNRTGEVRRFQFNPSGLTYPRGVSYATIDAPGMAYPETQFVKGNVREFNVTLFFWDKPYSGLYESSCNYYGAFLTPERCTAGYTKPPEMTFVMGSWVRTCVLTNLEIAIHEYDTGLHPVHFEMIMTIRQVGV
jgi:hypothetical protein